MGKLNKIMLKIPFEIFAAGKIIFDDSWHPQRFTRLNFIDWYADGDEEKESDAYELWADYLNFLVLINSDGRKRFEGTFRMFCKLMEGNESLTPGERTFINEALNDQTFPRRFEVLDKVYDYVCEHWSDPESAIDSAESLWVRFKTHNRKCSGGCKRYLSAWCFRPNHYACIDCETLARQVDYMYGAGYPLEKIKRYYQNELCRNQTGKVGEVYRRGFTRYARLQKSGFCVPGSSVDSS